MTATVPSDRVRWAAWSGLWASLPILLMIAPFGLLVGGLSAESGLSFLEAMGLSIVVYAGASQVATLELMNAGAPWAVVLISGIAVNLRFAMYAASIAPWLNGGARPERGRRGRLVCGYLLVDPLYGVALHWRGRHPNASNAERVAFFLAGGAYCWVAWQTALALGYLIGAQLPPALSLDFAAPIALLAIVVPLLRDAPSWLAAVVAGGLSVALHDAPYSLGVLIASAAAVLAGLLAERSGLKTEGEPVEEAIE